MRIIKRRMQSMMMWLYIVVLFLSVKIGWSQFADCPATDIVSPCECRIYENKPHIHCGSKSGPNLKRVFERISRNTRENQRHFYRLAFINWPFKEIESHVIGNLTFSYVDISFCKNLTKIHWLAFNNSAAKIEIFRFYYAPKYSLSPSPHNFFDMLNSFVNVKEIIIYLTNITHLPSEAFKPLLNLKELTINSLSSASDYRLSIAERAFYNLDNLAQLDLASQRIDYLPSNVFEFRQKSNQDLRITLNHNNLNSSSFQLGSLNNINRPVNVNLFNNSITFLDRSVFQPFLDDKRNNNITSLNFNPINCSDCRNAWLKKGRDKYKYRVLNAYCNGKKKIFEHNFTHCPIDVCLDLPDVYSPCACAYYEGKPMITCKGSSSIDLENVFKQISSQIKGADQKHFGKLLITNSVIAEIGANLTKDLTFEVIEIYAENITKIHSTAFLGSAQRVRLFAVTSLKLKNSKSPYNLFDILNSFINVQEIEISGAEIDQIPQLAFGSLNQLAKLRIEKASKSSLLISDRAFFNLKNLIELNLSGNIIKLISSLAFEFKHPNSTRLLLSLGNNKINSTGLANKWLSNINRPVSVDLKGNGITYLEKRIFKPFFDRFNYNQIYDLRGNPLNCSDCRNAWLAWEKNKYNNSIRHADCQVFEGDYDHCQDDSNVCKERPDLFEPCTCQSNTNTDKVITCSGQSDVDLKEVFRKVSSQSRQKQKHFKRLVIANSQISEIAANTTKDLIFDEIEISSENIVKIHSDAFLGTAQRVKKLTITEETINLKSDPKPYNSFDLINSFVNVLDVHFLAPNVDQIPTNAFNKLVKLKILHFGRAFLQSPKRLSIANDAFYNLDKLTQLSLKLNNINIISRKAFHFGHHLDNKLTLSLASNDLNQSSFAVGSLNGFKKPTSIDLHYNYIQFLDRNVFKTFLDLDIKNEISNLSYNPLNCSDCRNYWLVQGKNKYVKRVLKAFCDEKQDQEVIFDKSMDHCK